MKESSTFFAIRRSTARILLLLLGVASVLLSFGAVSRACGAEEIPDELVKLRAAFDKDIDFAIHPIRDRYVSRLETLKRSLGSRGDARGAAAVQDELDRIRVTSGGPGAFAKFAGTWKVSYSNGNIWRYAISADGVVKGGEWDGKAVFPIAKLMVKGNDVLLDWNTAFIERLKISDKTLTVEHYNPKTNYPASPPTHHGAGSLVSVQRE